MRHIWARLTQALFVLLVLVLFAFILGCSAGPQLPIATTPIVVSCTWNFRANDTSPPEGGTTARTPGGTEVRTGAGVIIADNDCSIDRSSATSDQNTTGNDNRGARVDARVPVSVSAAGGAAPSP